jgi:hypothetical protein
MLGSGWVYLGEGGGRNKLIGTTNFLETEIDELQLALLKRGSKQVSVCRELAIF